LHGVWLGHPLHPVLTQASVGAWLSTSILHFTGGDEKAARLAPSHARRRSAREQADAPRARRGPGAATCLVRCPTAN
ncbi:MAG: hypothetical protein ACRDOB_25060, partial [Streptosporangiaceae bacterium]